MPTPSTGAERRARAAVARLAGARLYLVCDAQPGGRKLGDVLRAAIAGGVDIVQLREKHLPDDELADIAYEAHAICKQLGALFIVNDRPHVALATGADGVHVGQDDSPVAQVRELVGPEMLIGLSTHTPTELDAARPFGEVGEITAESESGWTGPAATSEIAGDGSVEVDYIGVGPIHATPTKPGRPAVGLELVRYAAAHARVPFFAIGGIDDHNLHEAIEAGARRVAVVRAIANAADPEHAARALRTSLDAQPMEDALARAIFTL